MAKGKSMLYPQYNLPGKLRDAMNEWAGWAAEQAAKKLAENKQEDIHPDVWAHWVALSAENENDYKKEPKTDGKTY